MTYLYVTTPAGNDLAVATALMSAHDATRYVAETRGVDCVHAVVEGSSSIIHTRNHLVRQFLESGAEWMFMHDADVILPIMAIADLLEAAETHGLHVIGGSYPKRQLPIKPIIVPFLDENDLVKQDALRWNPETLQRCIDDRTPLKVKSLPAGCLLIHRKVFESLRPWMDIYSEVQELPDGGTVIHAMVDYFSISVEGGVLPSEDTAFCNRVYRHTDFGVWLAPWVMCGHKGPFEYRLKGS